MMVINIFVEQEIILTHFKHMIKAFGNIISKEEADKMLEKAIIVPTGGGNNQFSEINVFQVMGKQGNPNPQEVYKINQFTGERTLVEKYY